MLGNSKNFSLLPAIGGWSVTIVHGFLSAQWFAEHGAHLQRGWAQSVRFKLGVVLYYSGLAMLVWHDKLQRDLRAEPGPRYRVPTGGLFEYATAASYFAELWTWAGFAIMSWGPNGAFIFLVSLVNLVPRAAATHAWYLEQFPDYPPERKYLVPFVW
jgi:3-oxo-5-alpha-steroid 4-dehydrogenase 1